MDNPQTPKLFRRNENKVALSEVEEKLKVMRQKRLSRLSTFIDEQSKLLEERSTKSDVMEEAIMSIQQSAPEKVKFGIKPIMEDKSEDSTEESTSIGEKKKVVKTKKLFERFSCVGPSFDDEEEEEEEVRRDGIINGTLTLHRKSNEFKKDEHIGPKFRGNSQEKPASNDKKFTYGIWTPRKPSGELNEDKTTHENIRSDDSQSGTFSKDRGKSEKNNVLNQIAFGNLILDKKSIGAKDSEGHIENTRRHRSPVEKSNSFTSAKGDTRNIPFLDSKTSQSSENLTTSYATLTFPRKTKPTKLQDPEVYTEGKDIVSNTEANKTKRNEAEDKILDENEYEIIEVKDNKLVYNKDDVEEKLDSSTNEDDNIHRASFRDYENLEIASTVSKNETDEAKLAMKNQSQSDGTSSTSNPKSPIPTPRQKEPSAEYNTVLDFQTNMLHLTRSNDVDENDIEEFNLCYKKMTKLLAEYRRKMIDVEGKRLPQKRLNQIKQSIRVVDQRIKRYRGLKRDKEYLELKHLLSGLFKALINLKPDNYELKEERDELLKMVDRCGKNLAKKATKNEEAMVELFKEQIDCITAKRVVGTYI
ncbi:unnamed protein product [Acanthoscelides obtectus]|uniref:Uncharacterized protein n=1 Tax=Acanthoscelides obtectus TaxID=200917 RepID=A0A9P0Q717_ACAOB|nr:unnamed protein product [Acanthoscelides obtectus]CAK1637742.1 hypothetical protein AOBTE_LOCUS10171 [Acanthoscelides obtectus]